MHVVVKLVSFLKSAWYAEQTLTDMQSVNRNVKLRDRQVCDQHVLSLLQLAESLSRNTHC